MDTSLTPFRFQLQAIEPKAAEKSDRIGSSVSPPTPPPIEPLHNLLDFAGHNTPTPLTSSLYSPCEQMRKELLACGESPSERESGV